MGADWGRELRAVKVTLAVVNRRWHLVAGWNRLVLGIWVGYNGTTIGPCVWKNF